MAASDTTDISIDELKERLEEEGEVPSTIFNSRKIFELEKQNVFGKSWIFLGHETEIPEPGDYVVRYICDDPFIVIRNEDDGIDVLYNSCRHQGMNLCRAEKGNASHFRCPYHGWTYNNDGDLVGVPYEDSYGEDGINREEWGLRAPRNDTYKGLIFACLNQDTPSLDDYLGGMKWYLDYQIGRTEAGIEVQGPPQRWVVDADWKLGAVNFISDAYHTAVTHKSAVDTGTLPVTDLPQEHADFHRGAMQVFAEGGGMGFMKAPPNFLSEFFPEEVLDALDLSAEHMDIMMNGLKYRGDEDTVPIVLPSHGSIFPNMSFLTAWGAPESVEEPVPYTTLRVWHPKGPGKMEVWSWCVVEKEAPKWYKEISYKSYTHTFGSSGTLEQDDAENWRQITNSAKGIMAEEQYLNYTMGKDQTDTPMSEWPGPGNAYPASYNEANSRHFYEKYYEYMGASK